MHTTVTMEYTPKFTSQPNNQKDLTYILSCKKNNINNYWIGKTNIENNLLRKTNYLEYLYWIAFGLILLVGYKYFSDGSFSAILTLSSAFQCFAFLLLTLKVNTQCTISGISLKSQMLYTIALISRLSSTLFFNGYLPVDRSGDWVYQAADIISLGLSLLLIFWGYTKYKYQYKYDQDKFIIWIPIIFGLILAIIIHPDLNSYFPADFAWTFALYIETIAMLPQLVLMTKIGGEVETLTSHYIASLAVSKCLSFVFWLFSFRELAPEVGKNIAGWTVMLALGTQILLFADFLYAYIKSLRLGKLLTIPTNIV
ncbi:hypothetical protein ACR3K2_33560 [Cryptosporidium serpentis]